MMHDDEKLRSLLRNEEGTTYYFRFTDGGEWLAEIISSSHIDLDDTLLLDRIGVSAERSGWQVHLNEIAGVSSADGHILFDYDPTNNPG